MREESLVFSQKEARRLYEMLKEAGGLAIERLNELAAAQERIRALQIALYSLRQFNLPEDADEIIDEVLNPAPGGKESKT